MHYEGFTLHFMMWELNLIQVFWWHDVLLNRLKGESLNLSDGKTMDNINNSFVWDEKAQRWK